MIDYTTVNFATVLSLSSILSTVTYFLLSLKVHKISKLGFLFSVVFSITIIIPFSSLVGPTSAVLVGAGTGFAAFMMQGLQDKKPLGIGIVVLVLIPVILYTVVENM